MGRIKKAVLIEPVQKKWLSANEAKKFLGCSDALLEKLRNNAEVSFARYGSKMIWYELKSLERFIEQNMIV